MQTFSCSIWFQIPGFASPDPPSMSSSHIHWAVLTRQVICVELNLFLSLIATGHLVMPFSEEEWSGIAQWFRFSYTRSGLWQLRPWQQSVGHPCFRIMAASCWHQWFPRIHIAFSSTSSICATPVSLFSLLFWFLPLDEAIASKAVFVIVSGWDGWEGGRAKMLLEPAE